MAATKAAVKFSLGFVAFIALLPLASPQDTDTCFKKPEKAMYMPGPFLAESKVRSKIACVKNCAQHQQCRSINYDEKDGKCELSANYAVEQNSATVEKAGVSHMRKGPGRENSLFSFSDFV